MIASLLLCLKYVSGFNIALQCQPSLISIYNDHKLTFYKILTTQGIPRVVPITEGYNPATWMLEVTTQASEERLGIDFATVYKNSYQFRLFLVH